MVFDYFASDVLGKILGLFFSLMGPWKFGGS